MNKKITTLGKWSNRQFDIPYADNIVQSLSGESIMVFGLTEYMEKSIRPYYAIGVVYKIIKGEKFDVVYCNFGYGRCIRPVCVFDNHSRRQIMTLKKGQFCQIYGYMKHYIYKDKKGIDKNRWIFYARAIQGWYVPRAVDIKRNPNNDIVEMPKDDENNLINFLDQFENKDD